MESELSKSTTTFIPLLVVNIHRYREYRITLLSLNIIFINKNRQPIPDGLLADSCRPIIFSATICKIDGIWGLIGVVGFMPLFTESALRPIQSISRDVRTFVCVFVCVSVTP